MKKILLLVAVMISVARAGMAEETPSPSSVIGKALEALGNIRSVSYDFEEKTYFNPDDSLFIKKENYRCVEYENRGDSTGLTKFMTLSPDGKCVMDSYDGRFQYNYRGYENYVAKTDVSRQTVVLVRSPFYNFMTRLCEYILEPDPSKNVTVEDHDGYFEVDAEIKGKDVYFYGYVRENPHSEGWSRFTVRLDKKDFLPYWISWGSSFIPRREWEVSEVKVNAPDEKPLDIESHLPQLPVLMSTSSAIRKYSRENYRENRETGMKCEIPSDTLRIIGGGDYSLKANQGKVRVLMLTLLSCGSCVVSYPQINQLYAKYSGSPDVDVAGVLYNGDGEMDAYDSFLKRYDIRFPLALNNGRFYSVFSRIPVAPIFIVIDRNDKVVLYHEGRDDNLYDIIEGKIQECLSDTAAS